MCTNVCVSTCSFVHAEWYQIHIYCTYLNLLGIIFNVYVFALLIFLMLSPGEGCTAFKVFQPLIFQRVVDLFKLLLPEEHHCELCVCVCVCVCVHFCSHILNDNNIIVVLHLCEIYYKSLRLLTFSCFYDEITKSTTKTQRKEG